MNKENLNDFFNKDLKSSDYDLYDSINNKIKPLNDDITVYPGHGAGSACGKSMMKETVDSLSNQKIMNYSLNGTFTKTEFIKELTNNLPEPPAYFPANVKLNQEGYDDLSVVMNNSLNFISSAIIYFELIKLVIFTVESFFKFLWKIIKLLFSIFVLIIFFL